MAWLLLRVKCNVLEKKRESKRTSWQLGTILARGVIPILTVNIVSSQMIWIGQILSDNKLFVSFSENKISF